MSAATDSELVAASWPDLALFLTAVGGAGVVVWGQPAGLAVSLAAIAALIGLTNMRLVAILRRRRLRKVSPDSASQEAY